MPWQKVRLPLLLRVMAALPPLMVRMVATLQLVETKLS